MSSAARCSESTDDCPICHGTGWEQVEHDGIMYARECDCGKRRRDIAENRLLFACIPESFKNIRMSDFQISAYSTLEGHRIAQTAIGCINVWLSDFEAFKRQGIGLYMHSTTKGSGKTRAAVSIANELLDQGTQVRFATSLQILDEIKATWDGTAGKESELLSMLGNVELLIVDDFDVEIGNKPWINERFYSIVNTRYINKLPTIYTSNSSISRLRYDERITNRIKERCYAIPFPEESVRERIAKKNMQDMARRLRDANSITGQNG